MPKYHYNCNSCTQGFYVYHGMSEDHNECLHCGSEDIHRVPEMPFVRREITTKGTKAGDRVRDAIEENREILKEAKKEAQNRFYGDEE